MIRERIDTSLKDELNRLYELVLRRRFNTGAHVKDADVKFLGTAPTKSLTYSYRPDLDFENEEKVTPVPSVVVVKRYHPGDVMRTSETALRSCADEFEMETAFLSAGLRHNLNGNAGEIQVYPEPYSAQVPECRDSPNGRFIFREYIPGRTIEQLVEEMKKTGDGSVKLEPMLPVVWPIALLHVKGPLIADGLPIKPQVYGAKKMAEAYATYLAKIAKSKGTQLTPEELRVRLQDDLTTLLKNFDNPDNQVFVNADLDCYTHHVMPGRLLDAGGTQKSHFVRDLGLWGDPNFLAIQDAGLTGLKAYLDAKARLEDSLRVPKQPGDMGNLYQDLIADFVWGNFRRAASLVNYKTPYVGSIIPRAEFEGKVQAHLDAGKHFLKRLSEEGSNEVKQAASRVLEAQKEFGFEKPYHLVDRTSLNEGIKQIRSREPGPIRRALASFFGLW